MDLTPFFHAPHLSIRCTSSRDSMRLLTGFHMSHQRLLYVSSLSLVKNRIFLFLYIFIHVNTNGFLREEFKCDTQLRQSLHNLVPIYTEFLPKIHNSQASVTKNCQTHNYVPKEVRYPVSIVVSLNNLQYDLKWLIEKIVCPLGLSVSLFNNKFGYPNPLSYIYNVKLNK